MNEWGRIINVKMKDGTKEQIRHCDYYVQDGFLTVFRSREIEEYHNKYPKLEKHFSMDCVQSIEIIER